jgi:diguanylate cyclase
VVPAGLQALSTLSRHLPKVVVNVDARIALGVVVPEPSKKARGRKSAVALAIAGVIVALLWAQGHYQLALGVLSVLSVVVVISSWLTVATLREQVNENEFAALHDPLTELPNRLLFHDRVHQAILAARRSGSRAAVIMLDVDRFKEINDSLGHHTGDLALYEVGRRLTETLRLSDSVARLNGDEFAVLLPEVDDDLSAAAAATKVREALAEPFTVEELDVEMEATAGIALYPDHGEDPETLLQHAEVAMYNAKRSHAGHELYAAARDEFSPSSLRLVGELRHGIANGELELHYQPKVRLSDNEVVGVEALVRWQHPEHGLMPPESFIPLAEHTGLIRPLALEVLAAALDQVASWRKDGLDLCVAVNLSPRNVMDPDLPRQIKQLLEERNLPPRLLELEVTENTLMADPKRSREMLMRLDAMRVWLAVDDFGTGYTSLTHLKQVPVTSLKVDRSFVMSMESDEDCAVIVRSTIALGRNLGLRVVAEGVESESALNELRDLGCDFAQGFHLSRPLPGAEVERWVRERPFARAAESAA